MKQTVVDTFTATIYVGLKERDTEILHSIDLVRNTCQKYCDEVGLCVTVTLTEYIYTDGQEAGAIIGLINYPRFPATPMKVRGDALYLAQTLMEACNQYRVTVVFPDQTIMLSDPRFIQCSGRD